MSARGLPGYSSGGAVSIAGLWLVLGGETMFPTRAPFLNVGLGPRGAQVAARAEQRQRGKVLVPPDAPSSVHDPEVGR